jgi:hypothetical protein
VRLEGLGQLKKSTSSGLEPATFRLLAYCLNQLRYRVTPKYLFRLFKVTDIFAFYSLSHMQSYVKILKFTCSAFQICFNITGGLHVLTYMVIMRCFENCCWKLKKKRKKKRRILNFSRSLYVRRWIWNENKRRTRGSWSITSAKFYYVPIPLCNFCKKFWRLIASSYKKATVGEDRREWISYSKTEYIYLILNLYKIASWKRVVDCCQILPAHCKSRPYT